MQIDFRKSILEPISLFVNFVLLLMSNINCKWEVNNKIFCQLASTVLESTGTSNIWERKISQKTEKTHPGKKKEINLTYAK